jgi:uncharacterized protein with von Willebrand factor type A (vWA) domain
VSRRNTFSRWDGTQAGPELAGDELLDELGDDLLYHGDVNSALRRLLQEGFRRPDGTDVQGLRELMERLRQLRQQELRRPDLTSAFDQMGAALRDISPEERRRAREMAADLNKMIEQRARGDEPTDPTFDEFMERHGDLVPGNPHDLDELLEQMAQRMAAMHELMSRLTPEQREELNRLMESMLDGDPALQGELDRLAANLGMLGAQMGGDPLSLTGTSDLTGRLAEMDSLETLLRMTSSPGTLADVDLEAAERLLGTDAADSLRQMAELAERLKAEGLIEQREGKLELTPRGSRRIGERALKEMFADLAKDRLGRHESHQSGVGHERNFETRPYQYGDPFNLHIGRTIDNAIRRTQGGVPVSISPEDFEIEQTESVTRAATVLMVDLSLSMPMRDNFLGAKKVAVALHSLISSRFPRDYLGIVVFSEVARVIQPAELPKVSWDFVYGTNMAHGLALSRKLLVGQPGTRQILMVTDGEPTAHPLPDGEVFFSYPPAPETIDATLRQVLGCTRDGIRINTFMLDATPALASFVERMTQMNRGRAFFTDSESLGRYVLVDYLEGRRAASRVA